MRARTDSRLGQMRGVSVIIPLSFFARAHTRELAANRTRDARISIDKKANTWPSRLVDQNGLIDKLIDKLVVNLFSRSLHALSFFLADLSKGSKIMRAVRGGSALDNSTLGMRGHFAVPLRAKLMPLFPFGGSSVRANPHLRQNQIKCALPADKEEAVEILKRREAENQLRSASKNIEGLGDTITKRLLRDMRREAKQERWVKHGKRRKRTEPEQRASGAQKTEFAGAIVPADTFPGAGEGNWKTSERLRIVGGSLGKRFLLSPQIRSVRPMMEIVRGSIMDMLLSRTSDEQTGTFSFPRGSRWLDLYAGTGAVGIEAVSRGCGGAHFVECDGHVVRRVLKENIEKLDVSKVAEDNGGAPGNVAVHMTTVEAYLQRHQDSRSPPFTYVSVCPPYQIVEYPVLLELLSNSGALCANTSNVVVEYPREEAYYIQKNLTVVPPDGAPAAAGSIPLVRQRKFGRTIVAIYQAGGIPIEESSRRHGWVDVDSWWQGYAGTGAQEPLLPRG